MIQYYWSKAFDFNQSNGQSASAANDLAVLVLSSRLVYAENLGPVCLPEQPPPPPGTQVAGCLSALAPAWNPGSKLSVSPRPRLEPR